MDLRYFNSGYLIKLDVRRQICRLAHMRYILNPVIRKPHADLQLYLLPYRMKTFVENLQSTIFPRSQFERILSGKVKYYSIVSCLLMLHKISLLGIPKIKFLL